MNRRTVPAVYWASLQKAPSRSSSSDQQAGPPLSKRDLLIVIFGPSLWLGMATWATGWLQRAEMARRFGWGEAAASEGLYRGIRQDGGTG